MATPEIFSDGRRFHQAPPGAGEVNGTALSGETIEPRFPGVGEEWAYDPTANNFRYVGKDPEIIRLKKAFPYGVNGTGK